MRRNHLIKLSLAPVALALGLSLLWAAPTGAQRGVIEPTPSDCQPPMDRSIEPAQIELGQTAKVTLNLRPVCPDYRLPIDLVFLVDVSNSMTRARVARGNADPEPGDPIVDPPSDPPKEPPPVPPKEPPEPPMPLAGLAQRIVGEMALGGTIPNQVPEPPEPPEKPDPPPPPGNIGGGQRINPNQEPPGCQASDVVGGGNDRPGPDPIVPGPSDPPTPKAPPEPTEPGGGPIVPPTKTPPPGNVDPGSNDGGRDEGEPAGNEDLIREAQRFIRDFFDEPRVQEDLDDSLLRVGLVSFNDRGRRLVSLTDQGNRAATRTSLLRGGGRTRIDIGLRTAERVLADRSRRYGILHDQDRTKVIVVISDGGFCDRDLRARVDDEIEIVTLHAGRAPWERRLREVATEAEYSMDLNARALKELMFLYDARFVNSRPVAMTELTVREELQEDIQVVPGSVSGNGQMDGDAIEWFWQPPTGAVTLTYEIEPLIVGDDLPVTDASTASWIDSEERDGSAPFPEISLDVLEEPPTATVPPTDVPPTDTPVPDTATPVVLRPAYLPVAYRQAPEPDVCEPQQQRVDLAIVVDTSNSMTAPTSPGGPTKLDAAIGAAKALVDQLKFAAGDQDQATVIGFNQTATLLTPLSLDRAAVESALDDLTATQSGGTRIDRGLETALAELTSARRRSEATQTVVLVTDALQTEADAGGRQLVRDQAAALQAANIVLFAVGLGQDALDADLLREIATRPEFYIHAPDAAELEAIYREKIAPLVPCP